jgi:tetratricopeptide (TPR) repeat protein
MNATDLRAPAAVTDDTPGTRAGDPELRADRAEVIEQAYQEYCQRRDAGKAVDLDAFCDEFPAFRDSLRRLLEADRFLEDNAALFEETPAGWWPAVGEVVDDFCLLRELGRGAFARVFLAREGSAGGRAVVVKLSRGRTAEARTQGRLSHPHIAPVLSTWRDEDADLTVVCMPWEGAATLEDVRRRVCTGRPPRDAAVIAAAIRAAECADDPPVDGALGPPPRQLTRGRYADGVRWLGLQLAEALAFLHEQKVCHRDLKPSNVLLRPDGRALLLDFNLASDHQGEQGEVGGTLAYMAPEQIRALQDEAAAPGPAADLFSLGVLLFELLAGAHPFGPLPQKASRSELAAELLQRQRRGCPSLRRLNPQVDRRLARLVERCLAYQPSARPQGAAEAAVELRQQLRRPRRALLGLGLATVLAVAFLARGSFQPSDYERGRRAYRAGDYGTAEKHFAAALDADGKDARAAFARGRARLMRREVENALQDFLRADELSSEGVTAACIGYCRSQQRGGLVDARGWYDVAIKRGHATAAVLNNRGLTRAMHSELDKAEEDFTAALTRDPDLQAAHYNRAWVALRRWVATRNNDTPLPLPARALEDMRSAIRKGPVTGELYVDAARCFACAVLDRTGPVLAPGLAEGEVLQAEIQHYRRETQWHLERAVEQPQELPHFERYTDLEQVLGREVFKRLVEKKPQTNVRPANLKLVDPAPDLPG